MRTTDVCSFQSEEMAEAYCLKQMPECGAHYFEEHFLLCSRCAISVEQTQAFVDGLRSVYLPRLGRFAS